LRDDRLTSSTQTPQPWNAGPLQRGCGACVLYTFRLVLTISYLHRAIRKQSTKESNIMNGSCACGSVTFTTPTDTPLNLFHCHCIACRKQSSSAFGTSAIFPFFRVDDNPSVSYFSRTCDSGRKQNCYFCNKCGSRILHAHVFEGRDPEVVAVKGGLLEGLNWEGGKHIFCRSAVVPIPEGVERWEGEPDFSKPAPKV